MQKDFFTDLLKRYREGRVTPEESRFLEAYYKSFETRADYTVSLSEKELEVLKQAIGKGVLPERPKGGRIFFLHYWKRMAAASVLLLFCSVTVFWYFHRSPVSSEIVVTTPQESTPAVNNLIQLPDGSTAILTPGSILDFPQTFEGQPSREVALTGEAYFDVERMPDKPFIVHSGKLRTTVLGTTFNVKALPGDQSITVTVISGKVQVGDEKETLAVLLPDEQIVYHVEEARKDIRAVDGEESLGWKHDDLHCDDITVGQAALLIEERYGVEVVITDGGLKQKRFTTTFGKEETLEGVLNSLALFNEAVYTADTANPALMKITLSPKTD